MIPKSEAKAIFDKAHEAELAACESIIDEAIKRMAHGRVIVCADGWTQRVCNALKAKYIEGGWSVEMFDDQKDGKTIVLS